MRNCKDISLKFMLDTTAYNKLYDNPLDFELAIKSLEYGFSYYNTEEEVSAAVEAVRRIAEEVQV